MTLLWFHFSSRHDSISSAVEQPKLYMFARSGSSIKDQALYTPVKVEHLKELSKSSLNGRCDFSSKMRVGIGKEKLVPISSQIFDETP